MGETTTDLQLLRCVSNVLWPLLRRRAWKDTKKTREIHPTGAPRGHRYSSGGIPGPAPTLEVLDHVYYLEAAAHSTETRLGFGIAVHLDRVAAHRALSSVSAAAAAEYDEALDDHSLRLQVPFVWKGDRYRRNDELSRRAAIALQAVAAAATIRVLTPEENDSLLEGDPMRPNEVFAAASRG